MPTHAKVLDKHVGRLEIPPLRRRAVNARPINAAGRYVLYWMVASRRATWNYGLQHAAWHAALLRRPLVVFEPLRSDYPWASQRLHHFVVEGMLDNRAAFARHGVMYYPHVEPRHGAGRGLLAALGRQACVVVTDDFPAFFLPHMLAAAGKQLDVRLEAVDSNGLLPSRAADHCFPLAHAFRRFLQKSLPTHLAEPPLADPLSELASVAGRSPQPAVIDREIIQQWPPAFDAPRLQSGSATSKQPPTEVDVDTLLRALPIEQTISRAAFDGGAVAGERRMRAFLRQQLPAYATERNEPDADASSGLSPYLHFGHVSAHQVFDVLMRAERWTPEKLAPRPTGSREGWWGATPRPRRF